MESNDKISTTGESVWSGSPPTSPPSRAISPYNMYADISAAGNSPPTSNLPNLPTQFNATKTHSLTGSALDHCAPEVVEGSPQYKDQQQRTLHTGESGSYFTQAPPYDYPREKGTEDTATPAINQEQKPKWMGLGWTRVKIILIGIFLVLGILALALGVGLGVGLRDRPSTDTNKTSDEDGINPFCKQNSNLCIGGYLDPQYYSTKGAFNGSGIAVAGESWNPDQSRIFTVFFQHWTGDIRFMQYTTEEQWVGGTQSEIIATDAKNGTAISTVSYALNETQFFHIFYISKNNTITQMTQSNRSQIWSHGPLTELNIKTFDSPSVGLQACWKGNYYGDDDYSKFPTNSDEENEIPYDERQGMNIWFPSDENTFEQYIWYNGQDQWRRTDPWLGKNAHAGVGCYSWGPSATIYTMMVNQHNDLEFWWRDTNSTNKTSTDKHPFNSWVNSTNSAISNVYPSTSLGYTTYMYMQMVDKTVKGYNISFEAEGTYTVADDTFSITDPGGPVKGLGGTHLTCTTYTKTDEHGDAEWESLYVFYQTEGSDIAAFTRSISGGEWTMGSLPIPDK